MNPRSVAGWLSFTLYVGAANADATPDQRDQLRERLGPLLPLIKSSNPGVWRPAAADILNAIGEVMGPDWRPRDEWNDQIKLLLTEGRVT